MSCSNATAPIDISIDSIVGKCDSKCDFSFNYNDSSCIATNRGDYISLAYDKSSASPVTYNTYSYDVKEIRIYSPSLHSFNGTKADGEIIIIHNTFAGANPLFVCIPIKSSNTTEISSKNLSTIINTIASNAPAVDEKTTVNIFKFNLNAFVPKTSFFSYTATEPFQPCTEGKNDYIVYAIDSSVGITENVLSIFKKVITTNAYDIKPSPGLYYNEKGSVSNINSSEMYIDCQPVGQSEDEVIITNSGTSANFFSSENIMQYDIFKVFFGTIIFVVIIYLLQILIEFLKPKSALTATTSFAKKIIVGGKM
jgi:carbonic anhydrase